MNRMARKISVASLAALLFAPVAGALGATTIVDNFGDGGWQNSDTRDGSGVNVGPAGRVDLDVTAPVAGPSGYNALRLTTDTASAKAALTTKDIDAAFGGPDYLALRDQGIAKIIYNAQTQPLRR